MSKLALKVWCGRILNYIPYSFIPYIGHIYNNTTKSIIVFDSLSVEEKKKTIFNRVYSIVNYAVDNIPFYREYYFHQGFQLSELKTFEDIKKIPVINKAILLSVPIKQRSVTNKNAFIANTGGSSGHPLSFYKTRELKIKEMAYFHHMWKTIGYNKTCLRLHFVGRSHLKGNLIYNLIENSIQADVYTPFEEILMQLKKLHCKITFLHGYPSVLYEFALYCEGHQNEYKASGLDRTLKGAFLKSEFPHPMYREKIEEVFHLKTFSHYGHTEVCALAGELNEYYKYDVLQSYGYVTIRQINGEEHIVTTTYDNFVSPLIQYDTEDTVSDYSIYKGLLSDIQISGGRSGEYIVDKDGRKLSLTGVIFGNHHRLFDYCSQIQIAQPVDGQAIVYYVPKCELPSDFNPKDYFESENIKIDFVFEKIASPIKTKIGKVLLKVEVNNKEQ